MASNPNLSVSVAAGMAGGDGYVNGDGNSDFDYRQFLYQCQVWSQLNGGGGMQPFSYGLSAASVYQQAVYLPLQAPPPFVTNANVPSYPNPFLHAGIMQATPVRFVTPVIYNPSLESIYPATTQNHQQQDTTSVQKDRSGLMAPFKIPPSSSTVNNSVTKQKEMDKSEQKPLPKIMIGKRRGASLQKALPTGVIKRKKEQEVEDPVNSISGVGGNEAGNKLSDKEKAWAQYVKEVNYYRSQTCVDDKQNRSLVK